jgi:hypothetical protein
MNDTHVTTEALLVRVGASRVRCARPPPLPRAALPLFSPETATLHSRAPL